jgi:hypothetical protein
MAALTGNSVASTYKDLLQVSNSNSGVDATLRTVDDGEGTASALKVSTGAIQVDNIKIDGNTITSEDTNGNITLTPNGTGDTILNGNVGIGTTSPNISLGASGSTVLTISASASARNGLIELKGTRLSSGDVVSYLRTFNNAGATPLTDIQSIRGSGDTTGELAFFTSNTERLRILSGGGLTFNGDTATANALDDYEEGTWTPVLITSSSTPTFAYVNRGGTYTKIGDQVTVWFYIEITVTVAGVGNQGITVASMPFTPKSDDRTNSIYTRPGGTIILHPTGTVAGSFGFNNANPASASVAYFNTLLGGIFGTTGLQAGKYAGSFTYTA